MKREEKKIQDVFFLIDNNCSLRGGKRIDALNKNLLTFYLWLTKEAAQNPGISIYLNILTYCSEPAWIIQHKPLAIYKWQDITFTPGQVFFGKALRKLSEELEKIEKSPASFVPPIIYANIDLFSYITHD